MNLQKAALEIREIIQNKQKELGLSFEEEEHIYTMSKKSNWPSVTTILKTFYTEFPTEEAAYKKAGGDPQRQEELIKEWGDAGDYATNLGSRVHYLLEKKVIESNGSYKQVRQPIFECDVIQTMMGDSMIKAGEKYIKLLEERGAVLLDTEAVLGDPELGYTGQPDNLWLIPNKKRTEIGFFISDWKSNKSKNFLETKYTKRLKPPFQTYPDTALGHYYVQLPFYGKLLLKMLEGSKYENIKLLGCIVVHLKEDSEYQEYRVPTDIISTVLDMNMKEYLK